MLSSTATTAYAGRMTGWKLDPIKQKYYWVGLNNGNVTWNVNNQNKPITTETTTQAATQTTTEATTETTTQATTEATTETTTQTTTETTTETTTQAATQTTTETATNNTTQTENSNMASQVLNLVNKERQKQNLSPLKLDSELTKVAQLKSEDMKNKNYFDHTSPTYGSPFDMMKKFGINYKYAGENIAKGQKTAEAVVNAWMNSEGHRKNILNKNFTDMGLGYLKSGSTTYWTQMFIQK